MSGGKNKTSQKQKNKKNSKKVLTNRLKGGIIKTEKKKEGFKNEN